MIEKDVCPARPVLLLLEDDAAVRRSLQLVLEGQGFQVRAYASPTMLLADHRGVAAASCLIADFRLADMDGIEALVMLREQGWCRPAILVSAHGSKALTRRALDSGFALVLEKPLRQFSLAKTVKQLIVGLDRAAAIPSPIESSHRA